MAQSTAKANQAATAASNAATQQNNQQMQAMQQQMAALQQQIAENNANMQAALDAQQQSTAQAIADAAANASKSSSAGGANSASAPVTSNIDTTELTTTQRIAVESGVSEDLLLREQISGEILSKIEDAEKNLNTLKQTMNLAFEYAGCDSRGDNCTGPKRVKKFKDLAGDFFDPYEDVLDDLYEAILLSQSVGVDVSNIYMMLNNSCERWAKYSCSKPMTTITDPNDSNKKLYVWPRYTEKNCNKNTGKSIAGAEIEAAVNDSSISYSFGSVRGGMECNIGQTIPPEDDTSCTMIQVLSGNSENDVARGYLYPDEGDMGDMVRVGCASNALKGSWLFRGKKQQASINIDTLRRIIEQDNAQISFNSRSNNDLKQREQLKYCALTESGYMNLQKYVGLRGLPTKDICINERALNRNLDRVYVGESDSVLEMAFQKCKERYNTGTADTDVAFSKYLYKCYCYNTSGESVATGCDIPKSKDAKDNDEKRYCERQFGGVWAGVCDCTKAPYPEDVALCESRFNRPSTVLGDGGSARTPLPTTCTNMLMPGTSYNEKDCCIARNGFWNDPTSQLKRSQFRGCFCGNDKMGMYDSCSNGSIIKNAYEK